MGSSPGIANLLVKFCTDHMLDEVESIDILHAHGGEPTEGAAVVAHRIHSMISPIPMYLDGKLTEVNYFGEDGKALEEIQKPPDTTGKPDEFVTVEEPALGEAPVQSLEEEKPSESKSEDETPEEDKR